MSAPDRLRLMPATWAAADGTVVTIRPIRREDLALEQEFVSALSASSGYRRLMSTRRPSLEELRRFTDVDDEREVALIATTLLDGKERQVGVARYVKESTADAEFAIVLSDDWQGRGLGTRLLAGLVAAAKAHGIRRLVATTHADNVGMLALAGKLGFKAEIDPRLATIANLTLDLAEWPPVRGGPQIGS